MTGMTRAPGGCPGLLVDQSPSVSATDQSLLLKIASSRSRFV